MVDVGGTYVKMMAAGHEGFRKFPSGRKLTASKMAKCVLDATQDWEFEAVSIGFPGLVANGEPARDPLNLGGGWVGFNFEKAFKRPVRVINDAAMQALANYQSGRMLFLGLGTSIGATLVADDIVIPIEVGGFRLSKSKGFADVLGKIARDDKGHKTWEKNVWRAVAFLRDCFWPDEVVLGGGNAKALLEIQPGCRVRDNQDAFLGAQRLWPGADMLAEPQATTWRIRHRKK